MLQREAFRPSEPSLAFLSEAQPALLNAILATLTGTSDGHTSQTAICIMRTGEWGAPTAAWMNTCREYGKNLNPQPHALANTIKHVSQQQPLSTGTYRVNFASACLRCAQQIDLYHVHFNKQCNLPLTLPAVSEDVQTPFKLPDDEMTDEVGITFSASSDERNGIGKAKAV